MSEKLVGEEVAKEAQMNLKTMIREKGYTQQSFAEQLGVGQTAVSNWCNQTNQASMKHIKAMAQVLGVTVDEVVQAIECSGREEGGELND